MPPVRRSLDRFQSGCLPTMTTAREPGFPPGGRSPAPRRSASHPGASASLPIAIERIWAELDIRPVLPTIQAPTLVLHRQGDPVERVEAGRDFAQRIPGARFVELAGDDWPVWAGDQGQLFDSIESFLRGIREEEAELDRVLATVLFTDIVGSTRKCNQFGDEVWTEILISHFRRARKVVNQFNGFEIKIIGDAFMVAFRSVREAICFAMELQRKTGHEEVAVSREKRERVVPAERGVGGDRRSRGRRGARARPGPAARAARRRGQDRPFLRREDRRACRHSSDCGDHHVAGA